MLSSEIFSKLLLSKGFDFYTGVPCSLLSGLIRIIDDDPKILSEQSMSSISLKIILGIVGLWLGAHTFVLGAIGLAEALGVSSLVIGMSIVALGTSLPELAASIAAAKHGETVFIIGNIIGSNIMNILVVLGFTLLISPISVEFSHIATQGIFMVTLTLVLFFLLKFKGGVTNFSSGVLILIYIIFLYFNIFYQFNYFLSPFWCRK